MDKIYQFHFYLRNKQSGKWELFSTRWGTQEEIMEYVEDFKQTYETDVAIENGTIRRTFNFKK